MQKRISDFIVHKGLIGSNGESGIFCANPIRAANEDERCVMSKWLYDEITCPRCRRKLRIPDEPSRGSLLRDNLAIRLELAFQFVDTNYWNREVRQPHEAKVNPDPDGHLASEFLRLTKEFDDLMRPLIEMMTTHKNIYGPIGTQPTDWEH